MRVGGPFVSSQKHPLLLQEIGTVGLVGGQMQAQVGLPAHSAGELVQKYDVPGFVLPPIQISQYF